jgi:hypothetical protein
MRGMKWLVGLVVVAGLSLGVVGALTAYTPSLRAPDERLIGLTLNGAVSVAREGKPAVLAAKGTKIDAERLALFRAAGVKRVRVREFSAGRWTGSPLFAGGAAALVAGAVAARVMRRPAAAAGAQGNVSYTEALERMEGEVTALRDIGSGEGWLRSVLDRLGAVQREDVPAVIAARRELTERLGLAGYAQFMDVFAAGERAVNRAWSSAADGHEAEAKQSLARAAELLRAARGRAGS